MSDQRPDDAEPPYPGWSAEQPPARPDVPGQGAGWQRPGGSHGTGSQDTGPAGTGRSGQQPGWGAPAGPGGDPGQAWGSAAQWSWATQKVKPGVIALRPLGVGEILDGAVTTIRKNLGAMLGLSVVVASLIQLGGLHYTWTLFDDVYSMAPTATDEEIISMAGSLLTALAMYVALDWLGRTILSGILTVVVSRAVLGDHMTAGEAWRRARPRLLRLLGLTIVYSLIAFGPMLAAGLLTVLLAYAGGPAGVVVGVLLGLAALPITIWLFIRYALAAPIVMIETVQPPSGAPVPIGVVDSLRRSSDLVRGSWWRVFGIYLLVWLIALVVLQAVQAPFSYPLLFGESFAGAGIGTALLISLGAVIATAITAPFVAGSLALLYIDRRIRAEGLDIELARAAGVTIPGRTDVPPGGSPQGR